MQQCIASHTACLVQAETKLNEAELAERKAADEYDLFQTRMKEEVVVFQAERSQDMTRALRDFALAQAKLAKQSAKQWKGLSDKMRPVVDKFSTDRGNSMVPSV
jgi:hypothetical protein